MAPAPTGNVDRDDPGWVTWHRSFPGSAEEVWAAVTEAARLERWIGRWEGDPASGRVLFTMTAEGEDVVPEEYVIEECVPPARLVVSTPVAGQDPWRLRLVVEDAGGGATLSFSHDLTDPDVAASVGPGWEYYLDRLVAAETGGDVGAVRFDDYYPALGDHYSDLVRSAPGR